MRKVLLFLSFILFFTVAFAKVLPHKEGGEATYKVQSKWNGGSYVNIFYSGGGDWKAVVTYTLPMEVYNITNGTYEIENNTITFKPGEPSLHIGSQLTGAGDAIPSSSYVEVNGEKIPFTDMPIPPIPIPDTYYLKEATYLPTGEIKIGNMDLPNVWESGPFSVQIPKERKHWAISLAHASQLFKNITGVEDIYVGPNHYTATAIQESRIGADKESAKFTYQYPAPAPILYIASAETDGFFQIEGAGGGSAYKDIQLLFPNRFGSHAHQEVISDGHFETSAIASSYFNIYMYDFLVGSDWKPGEFFEKARDPQGLDRVMALAYNRGLYSSYVSDVFTTKRAYCQAVPNMADDAGRCLPNTGDYGSLYVRQVPGYNKSLVDSAEKGPGYPGLYDTDLAWSDIDSYLDAIAVLYSKEDMTKAKDTAKAEFDKIAKDGMIKFSSQFGTVLDKIMLALPVDSPVNNLCNIYAKCAKEKVKA